VHPPLVLPLVAAAPADGPWAIAVGPDGDLRRGTARDRRARRTQVIEALGRGDSDAAVAATATAAERVPHGEIAPSTRSRRPTTAAPRTACCYRILVKPQDNAITRYLYRPVSSPLTRLLVWDADHAQPDLVPRRGDRGGRLLADRVGRASRGSRAGTRGDPRRGVPRLLRRRGRPAQAAVVAASARGSTR